MVHNHNMNYTQNKEKLSSKVTLSVKSKYAIGTFTGLLENIFIKTVKNKM